MKMGICGKDTRAFFYKDTRFLSKYSITVNGKRPQLIRTMTEKNFFKEIYLEYEKDSSIRAMKICRKSFAFGNVFYERFIMKNCGSGEETVNCALDLDADFRDMFDVRGFAKGSYGPRPRIQRDVRSETIEYAGLDGILRKTVAQFSHDVRYEDKRAVFSLTLAPGEVFKLDICVCVRAGD